MTSDLIEQNISFCQELQSLGRNRKDKKNNGNVTFTAHIILNTFR